MIFYYVNLGRLCSVPGAIRITEDPGGPFVYIFKVLISIDINQLASVVILSFD